MDLRDLITLDGNPLEHYNKHLRHITEMFGPDIAVSGGDRSSVFLMLLVEHTEQLTEALQDVSDNIDLPLDLGARIDALLTKKEG